MFVVYLIASFILGIIVGFRVNQCLNDSISSAMNELDLSEDKN